MSAVKKHEMMVFEFCFLRKDASHDDESGPEFVASDVEGDVKQTVEHSPDMIRDKGVGVQGLTYWVGVRKSNPLNKGLSLWP